MSDFDYRVFLMFSGISLMSIPICGCWRAVPANQAMYARRAMDIVIDDATMNPDDFLPRDTLNHIYKFGWCRPDVTSRQFLRKSVNMTLPSWKDTQADYIYLLENKHTQRYSLQCVVMKTYVNRKYLFYKSRLPLSYCQGIVFILMLNTVKRFELHEFYFQLKLSMPANFVFEFYHAPEM